MRFIFRVFATLLAIVLAGPIPTRAQTSLSLTGTWTLNLAKSTYSPEPPPFKRATRRIQQADDRITIVDDIVGSRGGIVHLEWTGKFDGNAYPVQGVDVVLTNAYRRIDDRRYELIQRVDGRIVATARLTISADGRTITTVTSGDTGSATTVHEKQ